MSQPKIPYPPCDICSCTGNACQLPGDPYPYEWPELVGTEIIHAKYIVEHTNLRVTGIVLNYLIHVVIVFGFALMNMVLLNIFPKSVDKIRAYIYRSCNPQLL